MADPFRKIKYCFASYTLIQHLLCIVATVALIAVSFFMIRSERSANVYNVDFSAFEATSDDDGTQHLLLRGLALKEGKYDVYIGYVSAAPSTIVISLGNEIYVREELPESTEGAKAYTFDLHCGTDRGRIDFDYPADAQLQLAYITISSTEPLYHDGLFLGVLMLILIPLIWGAVAVWNRSSHKMALLFAAGVVIVQVLPFLVQSGLHLGVDTRAHMMRIEGIYYGLMDGQFPVVINPEWNNSYGQLGVLYPNMFLYIPAVFRLLGLSQLGTVKLFVILLIVCSAFIAYESAKSIFEKDWQIMLAVAVICLDDMRLLDMLSDGRIGGALIAEMFYPLIIAGLINIFFKNKKRWYMLAIGMAGVLCCHVISTTVVCIGVFIFAICCIRKFADRETIMALLKAVALFAALSAGTIASFVRYYFTDWGQDRLQWCDFTATLWPRGEFLVDKMWVYLIGLLLVCAISFVMIVRRSGISAVRKSSEVPLLICGTVLFLMSTAVFPWALLRNIHAVDYYTNMLQDSYRFLTLADCFAAFAIPILLGKVSDGEEKITKCRIAAVSFAVIALLCTLSYYTFFKEFFIDMKKMLYFDPVIGEVEYNMDDYLPSGTEREWYTSDSGYISDGDLVNPIEFTHKGTHVKFSYSSAADNAYTEFPMFYYEGYVAEDETGAPVELTKGDRNRIRVYLKKTDTPAIITMHYQVPRLLSILTAFSMILWVLTMFAIFLDNKRAIHYNFKCSAKEHTGS